MKVKGVNEPIEPYFDENKFYNHGDNPVFKSFMKISMENAKGGQAIDHRTHFIDQGKRLFMTRNFDDFIQRDLKAHNFFRSFCIFTLSAMNLIYCHKACRRLIPIGFYGIRKITQTPFYNNFGPFAVGIVGVWYGFSAYAAYKCLKFTTHKFYRHIIQQNRNWVHEGLEVSRYGDYVYDDELLSDERILNASNAKKIMTSLPRPEPTYQGPYAPLSAN